LRGTKTDPVDAQLIATIIRQEDVPCISDEPA
jgi:hypothetical protein